MALEIQLLKASYYKESDVDGILKVCKQIESKYGGLINEVCSASNGNLETYLMVGLYYIESQGNPSAQNGNAIGIGQLEPASASNIAYWLNTKAKIMTDNQKKMLVKLFGQKTADCMLGLKWDNSPSPCSGGYIDSKTKQLTGPSSTNLVTKADLLNPEKNIFLSTMFMDYLIWMYSTGATLISPPTGVRMDRVITHYNAGQGNAKKLPKTANAVDTLAYVQKNISTVTSDYILKYIGRIGLIDILTR